MLLDLKVLKIKRPFKEGGSTPFLGIEFPPEILSVPHGATKFYPHCGESRFKGSKVWNQIQKGFKGSQEKRRLRLSRRMKYNWVCRLRGCRAGIIQKAIQEGLKKG